LVGVIKVTDPNGNKMSYNYDKSERLKAITDNSDNLLKKYQYHLYTHPPIRILTPSGSVDFGEQVRDFFDPSFLPQYPKCGSATRTLTITNTGEDDLQVNALQLPTGFTTGSSVGTIPAGVSTNIQIQFNQGNTLVNGNYSGNIQFISNMTSGSTTYPITASLVNRICSFDAPASVDFGAVSGFTAPRSFTITNNGKGSLRIYSVSVTAPEFSISPNPPTQTCMAPGESQTFQVAFNPQAAGAPITGTIALTPDMGCPVVNVTVTGQKIN
jgi:YD repeat-containing protein